MGHARICMKCVPTMHGYAGNQRVICIEPVGEKQGGCIEHTWAMHVICTGYAGTMMEYSWNALGMRLRWGGIDKIALT